jgi:hypothetical protein
VLAVWDAKSEKLFIEHEIPEIVKITKKTTTDVENKKEELRQMVGQQYRDLIDAADTIVTMASASAEVIGSISSMQQLCLTMNHGSTSFGHAAAPGEKQEHSKLHSVATQMKKMMDAPEQVWSALEMKQYCEAAVVYLMSKDIHDKLKHAKEADTKRLLKSFPIIGRQWTLISGFKAQIEQKVTNALAVHAEKSTVVEALTSMILLNGISCHQACASFLAARAKAVPAALNQDLAVASVEAQVREATTLLVVTLEQLYTIMYHNPIIEDAPGVAPVSGGLYRYLLDVTTQKATPGGESISGAGGAGEAQFLPVPTGSTSPMTPTELKVVCSAWLESIVEEMAKNCGKVLRNVETVEALSDIRDSVYTLLEDKCRDLTAILPDNTAASMMDDTQRTALDRLCQLVGGMSFDPWARILQPVFVMRAQAILSGMFRLATKEFAPEIKAATDRISASGGAADDCDLSVALWTANTHEAADLVRYKGLQGWGAVPFVQELALHTGGYTSNVVEVVDTVESKLGQILADAGALLGKEDGAADGGAAAAVAQRLNAYDRSLMEVAPVAPFDKYSDAIEVRRFLQSACEQFVEDLVKWVAVERRELQQSILAAEGDVEPAIIFRLLFLGRLCKAIAERGVSIEKLIMLPSESDKSKRGRVAKNYRSTTTRSRQQLTEHERRLKESKSRLLAECSECQMQWVAAMTRSRTAAFSRRVQSEDWVQMFAAKRVWQQHAVEEESEAGTKVKSAVILPSQPSSFITNYLCGVSTEVNKAGGHTIGRDVLVKLSKTLFTGVVTTYTSLLDRDKAKAGAIGPSGYVQILFDLCFLTDVLVGPDTGPNVDVEASAAAKKLIERVRSAIDPFDLDVYTPLLQNSRTKAYHRCSVLLGFFASLNPAHQGARALLSASDSHNTVAVADVVPRFPLLPLGSANSRGTVKPPTRAATNIGRGGSYLFAL